MTDTFLKNEKCNTVESSPHGDSIKGGSISWFPFQNNSTKVFCKRQFCPKTTYHQEEKQKLLSLECSSFSFPTAAFKIKLQTFFPSFIF